MSHYYKENGEACHTVIGKNGKERGTTIRDARSLSLFPSVTTVLAILAKPSLEKWKFAQITDACFAQAGEKPLWGASEYNREMVTQAFKQVDKAADAGSLIHEAIETHYAGNNPNYDYTQKIDLPTVQATLADYVQMVSDWVMSNGVIIEETELRLVNKKYGYAGTTDIVASCPKGVGIGDLKTRKTKPGVKITPYDTEPCQIAAYHMAKYGVIGEDALGFNLYLSTTELGRIEAVWYDAETLREEWEKFHLTLQLWQRIKKYNSGEGS
jgi:hypothetical protein